MPIYEYQCAKCGEVIENLQKMSDPLLTECPFCKEDTLEKLISNCSYTLKGTGWHNTDYNTNGRRYQGNTSRKALQDDIAIQKATDPRKLRKMKPEEVKENSEKLKKKLKENK